MFLQQIKRSFGADDHPACPQCGKPMGLTRRGPTTGLDASYERQIFTCRACGHEVERPVDADGRAPDEPAACTQRPGITPISSEMDAN